MVHRDQKALASPALSAAKPFYQLPASGREPFFIGAAILNAYETNAPRLAPCWSYHFRCNYIVAVINAMTANRACMRRRIFFTHPAQLPWRMFHCGAKMITSSIGVFFSERGSGHGPV
jgi:hypothetical protein